MVMGFKRALSKKLKGTTIEKLNKGRIRMALLSLTTIIHPLRSTDACSILLPFLQSTALVNNFDQKVKEYGKNIDKI